MTVAGIIIIQQQVNAQPEESVDKIASGILRSYNILADTKTGTTSLADKEVLQEMQQAAEETGEEFILLEHTVGERTRTITLFSYDIKGQINPDTSLPNELEPLADFPNQDSLEEVNDVRTALEARIAATEESSDQSEEEEEITVEEEEDSIGNNKYLEYRKSYDRDNNDDTIAESGTMGEEDKTDKITTKETEPAP